MRVLLSALFMTIVTAGLMGCATPHTKALPPPLDGKTYVGELKAEMGETYADRLIFKQGTFVSTACRHYGFEAAPYTAMTADGITSFRVMARDGKGEKMEWVGMVAQDRVTATAINTNAKGQTVRLDYIGREKK
jgi:hypothetical protein